MMYFYWKHGRVRPSVFYSMSKGELTVIQAFFEREMQERNEAVTKVNEGKMVCPMMLFQ